MQQTINQFNRAGWPIPGVMLHVDSPLAATLLLAKIIEQAEQNASWKTVWQVFWEALPASIRLHLPRLPLPKIMPAALARLPDSRGLPRNSWLFANDHLSVMDSIITQQLSEDIRASRNVQGDGRRLWELLQRYLEPTIKDNGIFSWAFVGLGIECRPPNNAPIDERQRIHRGDGPAIEYTDGWGAYLWHGVRVPRNVVVDPTTITASQIDAATNVEVRRVMIERMGVAKYVQESGAVEIARDKFGILLQKQITGDEPIVMVQVVNSTPEPDGSFKTYMIRVDPNCRTAREAVAWTFGMSAAEYDPQFES